MLSYFGDWKGAPFVLFGPPHLIGLAIILLVNLYLVFGWKNPSPRAKLMFRYTLATILVVTKFCGIGGIGTSACGACSTHCRFTFAVSWSGSSRQAVHRQLQTVRFHLLLGIGAGMQALLRQIRHLRLSRIFDFSSRSFRTARL